ncbi:MAG: hypothetical protein RMJ44_08780 [Cytophagales bacterium]|nr:hypothetical protein [Bernardetiaceae bacterium]MDW8211168.1 hypothetical protein [Cytophagales bacterium]
MKLFNFTFLLCCSCFACYAQRFGGGGYFKIGYGWVTTTGINQALSTPTQFSTSVFNLGGGGYSYLNRLILGGSGAVMLSNSKGDTLIIHGGGGFEFGYDVLSKPTTQLHATLLLGGRGTNVQAGPNKSNHISSNGVMVGATLHLLQHVVFSPKDEKKIGGFQIGLRISAWTSLLSSSWKRNDGLKLTRIESYQPSAIIISATFGGAGFRIQ